MLEFVVIRPGLSLPHNFTGSLSGMVSYKQRTQYIYWITYGISAPFIAHFPQIEEAVCHYLQPVMETAWALLSVHTLNLEFMSEVERDSESQFYRDNILTGHSMLWGVWVSWTGQMSLWLIKYTTVAGHWEQWKGRNHNIANIQAWETASPLNKDSTFITQPHVNSNYRQEFSDTSVEL